MCCCSEAPPGKAPQPLSTENGIAAAKRLVHILLILLKSAQFRIECRFILEEKFSREGFLLLITEYTETVCLLHKLTQAGRTYRWPVPQKWLGVPSQPLPGYPGLCVSVLLGFRAKLALSSFQEGAEGPLRDPV